MPPELVCRLPAFAEVILRVGLNLQRGQRLLIAEPYELQGVPPDAAAIVAAVRAATGAAVEVIAGDGARLRDLAERRDWRGFVHVVGANARTMEEYVRHGDALLFLQGSQPQLLAGIPADAIAELRRIGWEHFGPVARQLIAGATNWTVAPAPSPEWAQAVYADLPAERRLAALWETVFDAMRIPGDTTTAGRAPETPLRDRVPPQETAVVAWQHHLASLARHRDELNARHLKTLRYSGAGTELTVALPAGHVWCTAQLTTRNGLRFVANLPTEEVFTVPHQDSAEGTVHVSRPLNFGGAVIDGIELTFRRGRVVHAQARLGSDLLQRLLDTDDGAIRLGEVAIVDRKPDWAAAFQPAVVVGKPAADHRSGRLFYHPLLDENAANHIALGEAYGFCLRQPDPAAANRSLIHVDLPVDAAVELIG